MKWLAGIMVWVCVVGVCVVGERLARCAGVRWCVCGALVWVWVALVWVWVARGVRASPAHLNGERVCPFLASIIYPPS